MHSLFNSVELVNTQEIAMDEIQKISICYISESIKLYETEGDTLILKEYFNEDDPELFAKIEKEGDAILIRNGIRPVLFSFLRGYVELFIPKGYYGVLHAKTVSGKIKAEDRLVLSELTISNTSGRIELKDITAGNAVLSTVSGAIEVGDMKAVADVHSTSGAIRVASAAGSGCYHTVSGAIEVAYHAVTGDIQAGTTSGRIRLLLPWDLSFTIGASSVSGAIQTEFPGSLSGGRRTLTGRVGAAPEAHVDLKTVSGKIEVLPVQ